MAERISIDLGNGQSASVDIEQLAADVMADSELTSSAVSHKAEKTVHLRWQAFEAARLLSAAPSVSQQIKDALVLLPAMQRWAANPRFRSRMNSVLARACADAESAHEAIELADQVFSFLSGESDLPAAGDR